MIAPSLIIQKKRDGKELTSEEIKLFTNGILNGHVTEYQAAALMMAVYFQGMSLQETVALTQAILESGERYDLTQIPGIKVDKHSTGGVGDKVSLILAPLAAACGLKVPMMSGRGLGFSGGTIDKLESISGFNVHIPQKRFTELLQKVGCAMIGQSNQIVPADQKLYALRDVTATVESIPLIVASILSKKIAEGAQALVLDVKVGSGAFMKTMENAKKLAKALTRVAKKMKLPCRAVLTNMNQPLGFAVGNTLEVIEAVQILNNKHERDDLTSCDLKELTIQLCAHMLELAEITPNLIEGRKLAYSKLSDGSAWNIFQTMVSSQGGNIEQILDTQKLPRTNRVVVWKAKKKGYVSKMDTETIGKILVELGGGRKKASDLVDPRVGLIFHKKLGHHVKTGDSLVSVHAPEELHLTALEDMFHQSIEISATRKPVSKLILEVVD